jgi:adenylate cyclase
MAEERVQRRLAAIMAADVVGYSRLMGIDESGTLATLTSHLKHLIQPCVAEHGGRVIKTMGDGLLAEFPSVVDAVQCAVTFQEGMVERNAKTPIDQRIEFRIGINLGDVIVQDDDVFGDGVNVAARLEGLAEPGGICVSDMVHQGVRSKLEMTFDDLGLQRVKNIGDPIRVFQVHRSAISVESKGDTDSAPPLPNKPSIAVLPFENMSADPEQEYFSDGITEDIITELSKISGLFVIARHSAFTYKGKSVTLKQVGRELGVRCALEGSVRKAGNRLRITAQLIDTITDHHLWAERYDRDIEDIFAVQDEVAHRVADALAVALKPGEIKQLAHAPTENLNAYEFYLRARTSFWPPTRSNLLNARNAFSRVVDIDQEFAGGHAGTSISYSLAVRYGHSSQPEADAATALEMAQTAVGLDAEFARAHSALGLAYSVIGQHNEAIASQRRAIELQPGDTDGYWYLANCLNAAGNGEAARDAIHTALRLDPQYISGPYLNALGRACFLAGRYKESIEAYERNVANGGPIAVPMLTCWTASYAAVGRIEEARAKVREILTHEPNFSITRAHQVWAVHSADAAKLLTKGLRKAGLPE